MPVTLLTTKDLEKFKAQLLKDMEQLFGKYTGHPHTKWLKSQEVMDKLQISAGTLQNLRINGTLSYTKLGGILYYDAAEIESLLQRNKIKNTF